MIEIETTFTLPLTLRCDGCGATLRYTVYFKSVEDSRPHEVSDALAVVIKARVTAAQLREAAQKVDWTHILPVGQPAAKDLCPRCFRPAPEG